MSSGYIAPLNANVERAHVRYNNRCGIAIAADVYTAGDLDKSRQHPALIVGEPYGGVKEQEPCVYANELAQRGFVVLTFDQVFMGESGGEPRHVSSPELFTESFSAAVDFLGTKLPYVDREKIGTTGIRGSGGFSLSAAQMDPRIKACATASMYDMSAAARMGQTPEQIQANKERLAARRWTDVENGCSEYIPGFPEEPFDEAPAAAPEGMPPFPPCATFGEKEMKILVLNGSPRPNGNTAAMIGAFLEGAKDNGHEITVVSVCQKKFAGCLACEYCHTKGNGKCVQQDDTQEVYPLLYEAEMIILASPVYYHGFTGQLQCAINRIYALDKPRCLKKAALFLSSGSDHVFDGAIYAYENSFLDHLCLENMGIFTAYGKQNKSEEKPRELYEFGKGLK